MSMFPEYEDEPGKHEKPEPPVVEEQPVLIESEATVSPKFGIPWKSIIAFLTVFGGQLWARATVDGLPVIPVTSSAWIALVGGSFVAAIGVYLKANVYTVPQAEKNLNVAINRAT